MVWASRVSPDGKCPQLDIHQDQWERMVACIRFRLVYPCFLGVQFMVLFQIYSKSLQQRHRSSRRASGSLHGTLPPFGPPPTAAIYFPSLLMSVSHFGI